jgi:hypothetical protein
VRAARAFAVGLLVAILPPRTVTAQKRGGSFRDPEDGRLDLSDYLLTRKGLLPIPIIITEPAVGYGGGLAVAFFSQSLAEASGGEAGKFMPPTIAGAAAFYTTNGSYGGGVGLFHPFHDDQFRYAGALGAASLQLDFYGFDSQGLLADTPLAYTIDPLFFLQRFQARLGKTNLFVGGQYLYLHTKSTFDADLPVDVPARDLELNLGGLGTSLEYDSRDNLLDAKRGMDITGTATWYTGAFGSDREFGKYDLQGLFYGQPATRWGYGLRVNTRFASGDVPFFEKPFLSMRGLASGQYSNNVALLGEGELRFSIDSRWTLLGFGGAGRVGETLGDLGSEPTVSAGGVGFRYLMAKKLGLGTGIDFAFGPDGEFALYIQTGAAWR